MFYCWFTDLALLNSGYSHMPTRNNKATKEILKYYSDLADNDFHKFFSKYLWPCITMWDLVC